MARRECAIAALFPAERIGGLASLQPATLRLAADVRYGSWSCENSSALRKRRNISVKLGIMKPNHPAHIRLNTVLENCIFYISTMYEFSHRVGQTEKNSA